MFWSPISFARTARQSPQWDCRLGTSKGCGGTIGPRIRINRLDDASGRCSVSSRPDQPSASCPFTPLSKTRSTSSAISPPAARSASSETKRSGRGEPPPRPEPELRLPIFTRPNLVRVTTPRIVGIGRHPASKDRGRGKDAHEARFDAPSRIHPQSTRAPLVSVAANDALVERWRQSQLTPIESLPNSLPALQRHPQVTERWPSNRQPMAKRPTPTQTHVPAANAPSPCRTFCGIARVLPMPRSPRTNR